MRKPTAGFTQSVSVQVISASEKYSKKRKLDANNTNKGPPPKCSECGKEHYIKKGSVCFYKYPDKASLKWRPAKRFKENPED